MQNRSYPVELPLTAVTMALVLAQPGWHLRLGGENDMCGWVGL